MKKAALIPFFVFSSVYSQTLTQAFNEPKPGDSEYVFIVDTSEYKSGVPATSGDNMAWDLQLLKMPPASETVKYLTSASVPNATAFPGCDFVMDRPLYYSYFKSDITNSRTELLGLSSSTLTLHFDDPAIIIEYPANFGDASTDFVSGAFDAGFLTGFCAGTSQTKVDGKGTLKLPGNRTYNDVLRVKAVLEVTLTAGLFPVGSIQQTVIMFYHSSNKFSMLSLSHTKLQVMGSPASTMSEYTINALKPSGLKEDSETIKSVTIFPNPSNEIIRAKVPIGSPRVIHLDIFDSNGRLVGVSNTSHADIRNLEIGLYIAVIRLADGSSFTRKFHKI